MCCTLQGHDRNRPFTAGNRMNLVTENQLDNWVRGYARDAQELIVELVWRLVAASCPKARERRFPLGDSIGQPGPDGFLDTNIGLDPFVPEGRSLWEIGTGQRAREKATSDYKDRTEKVPESVRSGSSFVFVTPLSGTKDWEFTWNKEAQADWLQRRRLRNEWKEVRLVDGTKLIDWLHQFPAVELWLAQKIHGQVATGIEAAESWWDKLRSAGDIVLSPDVFLASRGEACAKLDEIFDDKITHLTLTTNYPSQVADFACAYVTSLEKEWRVTASGRFLVITEFESWSAVCKLWRNLILVAGPTIDLNSDAGGRAIQEARDAGHAVVYGVPRGGIRNSATSAALPMPGRRQLQEALEKSGYPEHQAHMLAERGGGDHGALLRLIRGYPVVPAWADESDGSLLGNAALLGSWSDDSEADRAAIKELTGKEFGQWIGEIREVSLSQEAPIFHHESNWRFISRYEAWLVLGRRIFGDSLDKLYVVAVSVLRERDPKFGLPSSERWLANISEKALTHSYQLRKGLAESLALLGSHPEVLTSCRGGKAESTADRAVRKILGDADWVLWGSLDGVLSLLAEASPDAFLGAVESALQKVPCPLYELFLQEVPGIFGANYLTGLLWALETLAWDEIHFVRACTVLSKLAELDPGGDWANRPSNSLTRIVLPWLPQTTASAEKRRKVLQIIQTKSPSTAWNLLLSLLPRQTQVSHPTHRPSWRKSIPDDWSETVSRKEYWEQVDCFADLAVEMTGSNIEWLKEIIGQLDTLPQSAFDGVLDHLSTEDICQLDEERRSILWNVLTMFTRKHRRFPDADWALEDEKVTKVECVAAKLAPQNPLRLHRLMFGHGSVFLYDETGDWKEEREKLSKRQQRAIQEILTWGGVDAVIQFAEEVDASGTVGEFLGNVANPQVDTRILPTMLITDRPKLAEFTSGYVSGRRNTSGWEWVDKPDREDWTPSQTGQFLCYLPFGQETWNRVICWLADSESEYWSRPNIGFYRSEEDLTYAIGKYIEHGNSNAAIACLSHTIYKGQPLNTVQAIRVLLDAGKSGTPAEPTEVSQIIEALQNDPNTDSERLFEVEWMYLPIFRNRTGFLSTIGTRLASDPTFFSAAIEYIYPPEGGEIPAREYSELERAHRTSTLELLDDWKILPGTQQDGAFSPDDFRKWLSQVKTISRESGHLKVALSHVGQILIHGPPDDGLWIHRAIANALEDEKVGPMRVGFSLALSNSRGAHWVDPEGKPERELAAKYRNRAEQVEIEGYVLLAAALRRLAKEYDLEAGIIASNQED